MSQAMSLKLAVGFISLGALGSFGQSCVAVWNSANLEAGFLFAAAVVQLVLAIGIWHKDNRARVVVLWLTSVSIVLMGIAITVTLLAIVFLEEINVAPLNLAPSIIGFFIGVWLIMFLSSTSTRESFVSNDFSEAT